MYNTDDLQELAMWPTGYAYTLVPDWANALYDPNKPRFAWRFRHSDGVWNDRHTRRLFARNHALRGLTDDPYEHSEASNQDADCDTFGCYSCSLRRPSRTFHELVEHWKQYYTKLLQERPIPKS